jgi:hypothetical protein
MRERSRQASGTGNIHRLRRHMYQAQAPGKCVTRQASSGRGGGESAGIASNSVHSSAACDHRQRPDASKRAFLAFLMAVWLLCAML